MADFEPMSAPTPGQRRLEPAGMRPQVRITAVIAIAVAIGVVVWALSGKSKSPTASSTSSSSAATTTAPAATPVGPLALSARLLGKFAQTAATPVYWAGPMKGRRYELTRTAAGSVFVRYLPPGIAPGAPGSNYLIVATYPYPNALSALQAVSKTGQINLPGGGIAVVDAQYTKSVHLAYPGVQYEVEVYDPSPAVARRVAVSGDVRPVP